jgi:hypothetical protein
MAKQCTLVLAVAVVLAACVPVSAAAAPVTLILKSGDRVRGDLVDLKGSGFVLSVRGAEQQFPQGDVAVIAFGNAETPAAETAKIRDGRAFVVLNGGDTFYGSLADIGGTNPLRLSFRTPDGDRDVNSDQIARIYFSRWEGMPASGGATQLPAEAPGLDAGGLGISVPANVCWTDTRRTVRQGQRVSFSASGEIQLSPDSNDVAGVAGSRTGRTAPNAPIPGSLAGALIGRVGNSRPFGIGDQTAALAMPASGRLFLGINDDHCADNRGQFRVQITVQR